MSLDMMNTDKGKLRRVGKPLRRGNPHKKCAHKTGSVGHGNGIYVRKLHLCLFQSLGNDLIDPLGMISGGDFRNDSAVQGMEWDLC